MNKISFIKLYAGSERNHSFLHAVCDGNIPLAKALQKDATKEQILLAAGYSCDMKVINHFLKELNIKNITYVIKGVLFSKVSFLDVLVNAYLYGELSTQALSESVEERKIYQERRKIYQERSEKLLDYLSIAITSIHDNVPLTSLLWIHDNYSFLDKVLISSIIFRNSPTLNYLLQRDWVRDYVTKFRASFQFSDKNEEFNKLLRDIIKSNPSEVVRVVKSREKVV